MARIKPLLQLSLIVPYLVAFGFILPLQADSQTTRNTASPEWKTNTISGKSYISLDQLKSFYRLEVESEEENTIVLKNKTIEISFTVGSQNIIINNVKFFLSDPIKRHNNTPSISRLDLTTLIDPVLRPHSIRDARPFNTVILDAGHGGKDKGSAQLESQYTLALALRVRDQLTKQGYQVVLTRDKDVTVPLKDRLDIIHAQKEAIVISLHFNAGPHNVHGMETYIPSADAPLTQASAALATAVHSRAIKFLNTPKSKNAFKTDDRGIRHARFSLLKKSPHPSILMELGFLSHPEEAANIANQKYQTTLADSIVRGIGIYRLSIKK